MKNLDASTGNRTGIVWSQIRTLYFYELRSALREKAIVINSILIPIFLYPFIMWAAFSGIMLVQGQSEKTVSRVAVKNLPDEHPGLRLKFERDKRLQLTPPGESHEAKGVRNGQLDALVEFLPADGKDAGLPGNFVAKITFNGSRDRSVSAQQRVSAAVEDYRREWIRREASKRGVSEAEWTGFGVEVRNVASSRQMSGLVLGLMLPILFVVMVASGTFYPAIDCTAGERERNTWETLMSSGANRVNIVAAKYLYVTTLGGAAGTLNLAAFALTLKPIFAPLLQAAGANLNFSVPLVAFPVLVIAAALLAGFVAAGMMIFASFARTFKEGQSMIMPFYLLVLLPPMFLQTPGIQFTLPLACIPVVNVTMMVRSAIAGNLPWLQILVTCLVSVAAIAACIRAAVFVLRFEDVMMGSYNGSWRRFLKERVFRRERARAAAACKGGT